MHRAIDVNEYIIEKQIVEQKLNNGEPVDPERLISTMSQLFPGHPSIQDIYKMIKSHNDETCGGPEDSVAQMSPWRMITAAVVGGASAQLVKSAIESFRDDDRRKTSFRKSEFNFKIKDFETQFKHETGSTSEPATKK